jgi:hypothetical protein
MDALVAGVEYPAALDASTKNVYKTPPVNPVIVLLVWPADKSTTRPFGEYEYRYPIILLPLLLGSVNERFIPPEPASARVMGDGEFGFV